MRIRSIVGAITGAMLLTACPKPIPPDDPQPACKPDDCPTADPAEEGPPPVGSQSPGPETR